MPPSSDEALLDPIHARVDALLAGLDRRIGAQLDAILHHPRFQQMERAWRGLWFLVERTDFAENIQLAMLPCTREELSADLANPAGIPASSLYATVYTAGLGRVGGEPYGAILADLEIGAEPADILFLSRCAEVASAALAPFLVAASPRFFGLADMKQLARVDDLQALLEGADHRPWRELREKEEARFLGVLLPRFLLRLPFEGGEQDGGLAHQEGVGNDEELCWGNAVYALGTRLTESFARYRWCPNITGRLGGGAVPGLGLARYAIGGEPRTRAPTEVILSERRAWELSENGFIGLVFQGEWDETCFLSACSAGRPLRFDDSEEGRAHAFNARLGTELPYVLILTRVMHYLRMMYRSHFAEWGGRAEAEKELNDWVGQFVADRSVVTSAERGRRPLRKARVLVREAVDEEAWHRLELQVRPHFKHLGAFFTLAIASREEPSR